jgi:crotonobetainyl-CoA:carnitine CoA-transferase CaiB-like acyl-CoA transferase
MRSTGTARHPTHCWPGTPDLIVAQLCAWGWSGLWAERRGFDSLVQAASGIASIKATADGHPGVPPAPTLDHGTGYLLAAAVLRT